MELIDIDFSTVTKDTNDFNLMVLHLSELAKDHFSTGSAFSPTASDNFDIMHAIITKLPKAYRLCSKRLQSNDDIIFLSIKKSAHALMDLAKTRSTVEHLDFWKKALNETEIIHFCVPEAIRFSPDFIDYICDEKPQYFYNLKLPKHLLTFEYAKKIVSFGCYHGANFNFSYIASHFTSEEEAMELIKINPKFYSVLDDDKIIDPKFYHIGFNNSENSLYNMEVINRSTFLRSNDDFILFIADKIPLQTEFPSLYEHFMNLQRALALNNTLNASLITHEDASPKKKI